MRLKLHLPNLQRLLRCQRRWRSLRYIYLKLKRLRATPPEIARGFAAGIFTGMMPLFGVQTIFAVGLATLIRGNPFAAALSTWISNPLTFVPLYMLNFKVGQQFVDTQCLMLSLQPEMSLAAISQLGLACLLTLTVGCVMMGLPLAIVSYFVGLQLAERWQRDRRS
ncbi:MAG: DUF2062 domain-containing protein [Leptolyngbyaceae cyanobacterium]